MLKSLDEAVFKKWQCQPGGRESDLCIVGMDSKINGIEPIVTDNEIQVKIDKECIQDCVQDRYGLTSSYTDLSDNLKADLQTKMVQAGATGTTNVVVLKFFLNSMEYSKIHNFPQHGLQFLAEVNNF